MTESEITAQIALLEKMASSGVLIVRHGDTSTQFQTMDALLKRIRILKGMLGVAQGRNRSRVSYISQRSKGYGSRTDEFEG